MLGLPSIPPPVGPGPTGDRDSLRLVTRRSLWDGGTLVASVPALAGLHQQARLVVNPSVLAELGTAEGESVRVVSDRGSLILPASGDFALPPGSALLAWNLPGAHAGDLIDAAVPVTHIRVETVAAPVLSLDGAPGGQRHG